MAGTFSNLSFSPIAKTGNSLPGLMGSTQTPAQSGGGYYNTQSGLSAYPTAATASSIGIINGLAGAVNPFAPKVANAQTNGTVNGVNTGLAPGQTTTQGNQSSPQPVQPTGTINGATTSTPTYTPPATSTTSVGSTPDPSSTQPYNNAINTQQTYASGQGTSAVNTSVGSLQGIAASQTPAVQQAEKEYTDFATQSPFQIAAMKNNPNMLANIATGNATNMSDAAAQEQSALGQNVANQLTGEQQQIGAGTAAASAAQAQTNQQQASAANVGSLTQPQGNTAYFGSPVTGGVSGQGAGLVNTAVQNAITQVGSNGADQAAVRAQLVSSYGAPAGTAFDSAMLAKTGGSYNQTNQSASSQQTASQGAATSGEAFQLSTALKQVDTINPVIQNFLSSTGINPTTSPLYNQPINSYIGNLGNPGAVAQYNTMMTDLQNFSSQIVASGNAQTPTAITAANALQNPSNLSMKDITSYMNTLTTLGQNRLSVLQSQAGASGSTAYAGQPATASQSTTPATPGTGVGSGVTSPAGQGLIGTGLNIMNGIEGAANSAIGWAAAILK